MRKEDVVIGKEYEVTGDDMDFEIGEIIKIVEEDNSDNLGWFISEKGYIIHHSDFKPANTIKNRIEPGMRVKYINNSPSTCFKYGRVFTVESIDGDGIHDREGYFVLFKNIEIIDFVSGDTVIYEDKKAKFIKEMDEKDFYGHDCVVSYIDGDGDRIHSLAKKKELSKPKSKDELEVGDKFMFRGDKQEVLFRAEDKSDTPDNGKVIYLTRVLNNRQKGRTATIFANDIEEVVYG